MNEKELINYYNKFNEEKRLTTKHGQVEYLTAMKYIHDYIKNKSNKIIEIGAGTGRYSVALSNEGYDVTAVELVKHNLRVIESKNSNVKCFLGNAIDLSKFEDNSFDAVLIFGPMYHLIKVEDKIKALNEAKRIVKKNGLIFISYCMNEYAVLTYGFKENHIIECKNNNLIDDNYHCISKNNDLYSMVRIEDIDMIKNSCNLKRIKIISQDGPAEYMKSIINKMDNETFDEFMKYHLSICERYELLGSSRHILDILKKES